MTGAWRFAWPGGQRHDADPRTAQPHAQGQEVRRGRVEDRIICVPMREMRFAPGNHFALGLYNHEGELHSILLHRVRQAFGNGELIWQREH
jgi:hypothetical protein